MSIVRELAALLSANQRNDFRFLPERLDLRLRTIKRKGFVGASRNPESVCSSFEALDNGMVFINTKLFLLPGDIIEIALTDKRKKSCHRLIAKVVWYDGDVDSSGVAVKLLKVNNEEKQNVLNFSKVGPWLNCA